MKRYLGLSMLVALMLPITAGAAPKHWHDDDKHWNKHWRADDDDDRVDHRGAECYFQPHDVRVLREYYEPRRVALPPGLAKKLYRSGHLPPGWERRMQPLPVEVERHLVVLPPEYRRGYIDGAIVVYTPRTNVIVDVVMLSGR